MNWKMILLGVAVLAVVGLLAMYALGMTHGRGIISGFQNPASDMNTFTMYYADWCGHCQQAKPGFTQFASKGTVNVNGVDCSIRMISPENEPDMVKGKNIKGYPTILFEKGSGETVEYSGDRTPEGYMAFLTQQYS